jgi:hypothetical protein
MSSAWLAAAEVVQGDKEALQLFVVVAVVAAAAFGRVVICPPL